ncbi:hypothetical protein QJQ45_010367 [Haematococcus lacustris]|nr:hypothetical protein QJQ45_010367 [Haematococcus lacustris]
MPSMQLLVAATTRVRAKGMPREAKAIGLLPEQSVACAGLGKWGTAVDREAVAVAATVAGPAARGPGPGKAEESLRAVGATKTTADDRRQHVETDMTTISDELRFERDDPDEDKVKSMEFFLPKGQSVWVKVLELAPDPQRGGTKVNGSLKAVDQGNGADLDPGNLKAPLAGSGAGAGPQSDQAPELGSIHRASVKRIEPYGVFVALAGYRKFGLVHASQVSEWIKFNREDSDEQKKAELAGVVSIGEVVYVKVVEVIEDDGSGRGQKIQCSLKLVDQKSGEDLDPGNLRYKPRGAGEGRGGPGALGSTVGEVVGGKIDWGHLAGDVKLYAGDHTGQYKLLEDQAGGGQAPGSGPPPPPGLASNLEMTRHPGQHGGGAMHSMLLAASGPPPPPPPHTITSVEEALAILEQASQRRARDKAKRSKSGKKSKQGSGAKKGKKSKESKAKKKKKKKSDDSGSTSSSSGGQ